MAVLLEEDSERVVADVERATHTRCAALIELAGLLRVADDEVAACRHGSCSCHGPPDQPRCFQCGAAGNGKRTAGGQSAGQDERALVDRDWAVCDVDRTECQLPAAALADGSRTADRPGVGAARRLIEHQRGVVGNAPLQAGGRTLERPGGDRRAAAVAIIRVAENQRAGGGQREAARAADCARKGQLRAAGGGEIGTAGQHQRRGDRLRAGAHRDQRHPAGGAERQHVRAAALQHIAAGAAEGHRAELRAGVQRDGHGGAAGGRRAEGGRVVGVARNARHIATRPVAAERPIAAGPIGPVAVDGPGVPLRQCPSDQFNPETREAFTVAPDVVYSPIVPLP